jgi:hypothetical protein
MGSFSLPHEIRYDIVQRDKARIDENLNSAQTRQHGRFCQSKGEYRRLLGGHIAPCPIPQKSAARSANPTDVERHGGLASTGGLTGIKLRPRGWRTMILSFRCGHEHEASLTRRPAQAPASA